MDQGKVTTVCKPRIEHPLPSFGFRVSRFELEPGTLNSELETLACPQPDLSAYPHRQRGSLLSLP